MKISYVLALALSAATLPAAAETVAGGVTAAAAVSKGAMIFSADGRRIGRVDRVRPADVSLIYNGKFIAIPLTTLSATDRGYTTSLNKADLNKL